MDRLDNGLYTPSLNFNGEPCRLFLDEVGARRGDQVKTWGVESLKKHGPAFLAARWTRIDLAMHVVGVE